MPKLSLTAYKNFGDPRTQRRVASVLSWVDLHLSPTSPEAIHHDVLVEVFGPSGRRLSKYLRANLLIQTGAYVVGKASYSYLLNEKGAQKLRDLLQAYGDHKLAETAPNIEERYPELVDLSFTYKEQSDRYWHPLQNIKREHKAKFWKDYLPFNYDIEACAPTILYQLACQNGLPEITLAALRGYLDDRNGLRTHVSALAGVTPGEAKRIVNSLFNGGRLAANGFCSAFRLMNEDREAMKRLQTDPQVKKLQADIRRMWARLELIERHRQAPSFDQVLAGTARPVGRKLKTSKQKWAYYFSREKQVLDAITDELLRAGIKHFTEHDGFRTDREIDVDSVEAAVRTKTGFEIKLSREMREDN